MSKSSKPSKTPVQPLPPDVLDQPETSLGPAIPLPKTPGGPIPFKMPNVFSLPLFAKEFRRTVPSLILWLLITGSLLFLCLFSFSKVAETDFSLRVQEALSAFPEELLSQFHLDHLPQFSDFFTYLTIISHGTLAIGCLYACYRGCRSIAKFESRQSIVLIYAQPVSRIGILTSSFLSQILVLFIYNLGLWGVTYSTTYFLPQVDSAVLSEASMKLYLSYFVVELLYLSIGCLLSVFLSHVNQASSAAFAVLLASLLLGIVGGAAPALGFMVFLSPYHYLDTGAILLSVTANVPYDLAAPVILCAFLSIVFFLLTCLRYYFKDFNV